MLSKSKEKVIAFFLGASILGLGAASLWMWKISKPVLAQEGELGAPLTPITETAEEDYTVSMKVPSFSVKDESYSKIILINEDYIIPYSDTYAINSFDLIGLNQLQLKIARNEIFARHGRIFESSDLKSYFESKNWYIPIYPGDQFPDNLLSDIEKENASFIGNYEKLMGY